MLTENRKRQHSGGDEESSHLVPQAKRQSRAHPLSPEPGRDAWDSETSNSDSSSSNISSPEHAAGSRCALGPAVPSAQASRQSWAAQQISCRTCRSTASSGRPTSIACKAEVSSETQDEMMLSSETPKD